MINIWTWIMSWFYKNKKPKLEIYDVETCTIHHVDSDERLNNQPLLED
jgi:hypothetical protein